MSSSPELPAQEVDSSSSRPASTTLLSLQATSRSVSPELSSQRTSSSASPISQLPEPVAQYFMAVSTEGFPTPKKQKDQPWKKFWKPQAPTEDGKLLAACPKICTYGSNNLGGL